MYDDDDDDRYHPSEVIETMPVHIPFEAHGACFVALICLKGQQRRAFHFSKTIGEEDSWALRDYVTETILRSADSNGKTASQLEAMVTDADPGPYLAVGHIQKWKTICKDTSDSHFGAANVDTTSPNNRSLGVWRRMNSRGS